MKRHELKDRVIVLTGATGGLGLAAAKALSAKGAKLALFDLNQEAVDKMAADLGGAQVAAGWAVNVRSMESLTAAMQGAAKHFGGIDVVIAGAGIASGGSLENMDPRDFDRVLDVNLNGVWRTFHAALPEVKQRKGYLLAISSMAAFIHSPLNVHYTASKAGVWALCNSARLELKHEGVGVGSFHPTFFKTPMMDAFEDGPCSTLVWNKHQGIWKYVALEEVIAALVYCIEYRRETVTVPKSNSFAAIAPGFARKVIEKFGFNNERTAEAMRQTNGS
jgi:NAD(P)-dependent dehydrogenase (short-subunit alcohol dehydrogenase family)